MRIACWEALTYVAQVPLVSQILNWLGYLSLNASWKMASLDSLQGSIQSSFWAAATDRNGQINSVDYRNRDIRDI